VGQAHQPPGVIVFVDGRHAVGQRGGDEPPRPVVLEC